MTAEVPPLEVLLARWDRLIWRAVNRRARWQSLDPAEVRAEALAEMAARFPQFDPARPNASFAAWALLIVKGAACRLRDARDRRREVTWGQQHGRSDLRTGDRSDPLALVADRDAPDPAEQAARNEAQARAAAAVAALPAEQREAVRLRFWAGAQLSGHGREQLRAGLAALRERLAGFDGGEP